MVNMKVSVLKDWIKKILTIFLKSDKPKIIESPSTNLSTTQQSTKKNMTNVFKKEDLKRRNFSPDEAFVSRTADRLGIKNYPFENEQEILTNLMSTMDLLQEIRDLLGCAVTVNSVYRCLELNRAVGSSDRSDHLKGLAADFVSFEFGKPEDIMKFLYSKKVIVDQCFCEGTWVHISRRPKDNRMMYGYYLPNKLTGKREFKAI